ncbi:hypothetical protein [Pseudomonas phage PA1C]|uniref:Uncharacterized protein n=1 Tax=Pseudomonas phage vB_PaeM_PS119XW TaxID=2601632 RepID=A0A5C1K7K5_9CAUD|nr:hypothetical protein PP933_gp146 [Pseudomonas phage vB_PaeM_PS119XW]QBX32302.1 hypothetical protein [Pseudomonas phage PA1C]QEM41875.1 hypothetical protein [Pseudomonas phage vB_PaeM_PS119XW]
MLSFDNGVGTEFIALNRLPEYMRTDYESSKFSNAVRDGTIACEYGHPKLTGNAETDYKRATSINCNNGAALVIGIDPVHEKAKLIGFNVYIRPFGPFHDRIHAMIKKGIPMRLGVRGLKNADGILKEIITFDILSD